MSNILVVGHKYDLYEKFDVEARKWVSRSMRYLAHKYGASLIFSSSRHPNV